MPKNQTKSHWVRNAFFVLAFLVGTCYLAVTGGVAFVSELIELFSPPARIEAIPNVQPEDDHV